MSDKSSGCVVYEVEFFSQPGKMFFVLSDMLDQTLSFAEVVGMIENAIKRDDVVLPKDSVIKRIGSAGLGIFVTQEFGLDVRVQAGPGSGELCNLLLRLRQAEKLSHRAWSVLSRNAAMLPGLTPEEFLRLLKGFDAGLKGSRVRKRENPLYGWRGFGEKTAEEALRVFREIIEGVVGTTTVRTDVSTPGCVIKGGNHD